MKKAVVLILISIIVLSLCSCSKSNDSIYGLTIERDVSNCNYTEEVKNKTKYKYINGYATFVESYENGYIVFKDSDFSDEEEYYGKLRWKDEKGENKIVSASQMIDVDGTVIYNEPLKIESPKDNTNTWDHLVKYSPIVKAKSDSNKNAHCYIKLTDSEGIEYYVMLTLTENINDGTYFGAAVYIVDENNHIQFWYDYNLE